MAIILITGMSGTGKTTALQELERQGYRAIDTDFDDWIADLPTPDGNIERQWREDRIDALLSEYEKNGKPLFIGGTVINQEKFYPRFDEIVLFSAPLETMLERTTNRSENPFGKTKEESEQIMLDKAEIEPLLREVATIEIDTRQPLADTVSQLAACIK